VGLAGVPTWQGLQNPPMTKNALFLLIDAMRYDVLADPAARRFLMPNLSRLADRGFVRKVVTNAQSTQFVMPALFSLTYPLDYGGYNTGIRLRPKSFVEVLKDQGFATHKFVTANQVGVHFGYERGFDTVRTGSDFRVLLEHNLDRIQKYEIGLWQRGEKSDAEAVEMFQREFGLLLERLDTIWCHFDKSLWPERLRRINQRVVSGLMVERQLVEEQPLLVMNKIAQISGAMYWRFLGDTKINRFKRFFWHGMGFIRHKTRRWIGGRTFPPFFLYMHFPVFLPDIINTLEKFADEVKGTRWFAYMHFMDAHDCRAFNRPLRVMARWRFLPRYWVGRMRGYTKRRFAYDTTLMEVDAVLGKFFKALENSGQLNETIVIATGDHASFYAENPRGKKLPIQVRTHYEDIEVPLMMFGVEHEPEGDGMIDSMGVTATLLDALDVDPDPSFKGVSAFAGGRDAVISESCGSGNADLLRRDIHFTVSSKTHRMMATLTGSQLATSELFDLKTDPLELSNVASDPGNNEIVSALYAHLFHERAEILEMRGVASAPVSFNSAPS